MSRNKVILILFVLCLGATALGFCQEGFVYNPKGRRNPFIPLVTSDGRILKLDKDEVRGDLAVEGIIYDDSGRSYAIVNGQVVGIGDEAQGYTILKIEKDGVVFIKDGQITNMRMRREGE